MSEQETERTEGEPHNESTGKKKLNLWPLMPVALLGLVIAMAMTSNAAIGGKWTRK